MNAMYIPGKLDTTEVDLVIHIIPNIPEEYEDAVVQLEKDTQSQSTPLAMEEVRW